MGTVIRPPAGSDELDRLIDIQREVWVGDDLDLTPPSLFRASTAVGAILLGAYVRGEPAGFVFSFPAEHGGRRCQHSHQLAVRPAFRHRGLGKALKWAQRAEALRRGNDLITWTFEPLLARNANLNLAVLGAAARTYLPDFYGPRPALVLAPGVPTDRLLAEWELRSPRVVEKAEAAEGTANRRPLLRFRTMPTTVLERVRAAEPGPFAAPGRVRLDCRDEAVAAEVPPDIEALRPRPDLVAAWQSALRRVFSHYFDAGYAAVRFMTGDRRFYVLERY